MAIGILALCARMGTGQVFVILESSSQDDRYGKTRDVSKGAVLCLMRGHERRPPSCWHDVVSAQIAQLGERQAEDATIYFDDRLLCSNTFNATQFAPVDVAGV
jgi:hypothetical protein